MPGKPPDYIAPDQLGSPHQIASAARITVWHWDHDPFGNGAPAGGVTYNPRFPGQYYDKETGLHDNGMRDYDPSTGRYIESDPIGLKGGVNTYAYVGGNPAKYSDLTGLDAWAILSATAETYIDFLADKGFGIPSLLSTVEELNAGYGAAESVNQCQQNTLNQLMPITSAPLSDQPNPSGSPPATINNVSSFKAADLNGTSFAIRIGKIFFGPDYGSQ